MEAVLNESSVLVVITHYPLLSEVCVSPREEFVIQNVHHSLGVQSRVLMKGRNVTTGGLKYETDGMMNGITHETL